HFLPLDKETDPARKQARIEFALAVRALRLLRNAPVGPDDAEAPVTLFASHAKRDLDPEKKDPVRRTQDALRDLPVRQWLAARGRALSKDSKRGALASATGAERVIAASVREALRRTQVRKQLQSIQTASDIVLDVAPEAVWLAWQPPNAMFLYPDPPLGLEE